MLTPLKSLSLLLVMISSMSVPIFNRFHATPSFVARRVRGSVHRTGRHFLEGGKTCMQLFITIMQLIVFITDMGNCNINGP